MGYCLGLGLRVCDGARRRRVRAVRTRGVHSPTPLPERQGKFRSRLPQKGITDLPNGPPRRQSAANARRGRSRALCFLTGSSRSPFDTRRAQRMRSRALCFRTRSSRSPGSFFAGGYAARSQPAQRAPRNRFSVMALRSPRSLRESKTLWPERGRRSSCRLRPPAAKSRGPLGESRLRFAGQKKAGRFFLVRNERLAVV